MAKVALEQVRLAALAWREAPAAGRLKFHDNICPKLSGDSWDRAVTLMGLFAADTACRDIMTRTAPEWCACFH